MIDTQQPIVIHVPPHEQLPPENRIQVIEAAPAQTPPREEPATMPAETKRAFSLDALRGLFLVSMTFGFTIESLQLPIWMYHRQFPPPGDVAVDVAGISWRDLTYVSFLFTMAAALPLTLSRRIDRGETEIGIIIAAVRRYAVLLVFGLLMSHADTYFLGYTQTARLLSIAGFVIMALVFTRRRKDWDEARYRRLNRIGWILAIAFLAFSPLAYGKTFSFDRIDDIIVDLAFASLAGSLIWYFTRNNLQARLGILAVVVALYLGARADGWLQHWWYSSPLPWAFVPSRLSLLTVVIPGTIAGDVIRQWMRSSDEPAANAPAWGSGRLVLLIVLCAVITPIVVVGMYTRAVEPMTQIVLALLAAGVALTWRPATSFDRMLRSLYLWGALWLTLGLFLEPLEGGIKKVPETLTYFFTVTGTTSLLLVGMTALLDGLKRRSWVAVLIDVGQNPLLGYVLFTVLLNSVLELIPPLRGVLESSPGESVLRSIIEVMLVVLIVRYASRKRIYWRT